MEKHLFFLIGLALAELECWRRWELDGRADAFSLEVDYKQIFGVLLELEDGRVVVIVLISLHVLVVHGVLPRPDLLLLVHLASAAETDRHLAVGIDKSLRRRAVHDPLSLLLAQLIRRLQFAHILRSVVVPLFD